MSRVAISVSYLGNSFPKLNSSGRNIGKSLGTIHQLSIESQGSETPITYDNSNDNWGLMNNICDNDNIW